jgi:hypothetical protein
MVKKIWGITVNGTETEIHDFNRPAGGMSILPSSVMVIERYKNGELVIVAGETLVYRGKYTSPLPFVRQTCENTCGSFFGKSVIERAIPVQRAYNLTKNRKAEFLNRLSCGVLAVECGSVNVEALENDGLAPGTIIEYTVGTQTPKFVDNHEIPKELGQEEERLLNELAQITGGSDMSRGEFSNVSGIALEIMVAQDQLRIRRALQSGQNARCLVAQKLLQLYRENASSTRLDKLTHGKLVEIFTWSKNDITSDEVEVENGTN